MNNEEIITTALILKQAKSNIKGLHDIAGNAIMGSIPHTRPFSAIGGIASLASDTKDEEGMEEMNDQHALMSYAPGVGAYNRYKRLGYSMRGDEEGGEHANSNAWKALLGTGAINVASLAAMAGALNKVRNQRGPMSKSDKGQVALLSALSAGGLLANTIGGAAGSLKGKKHEEQAEDDEKSQGIANLLPGVGSYRTAQRIRSTEHV